MRLLLTLCLLAFLGNSYAQFDVIEDEVFELLKKDKDAKAFKVIDDYLAADPENDSLVYLKGEMHYYLGDGKSAFQEFTKVIDKRPDYFDAFISRGALCMDLHLFEEAKLDYDHALRISDTDSSFALSKKGLASYYLYTRDFHKSVEYLEEVLAVFPDDIPSLNNIAIALEDIDRKDDAIDYLKRVVELDSVFTPAYINLGYQLSHVERYEEALQYFDMAAELDKDEPLIYSNRGFVYYHMGAYKKALSDLNYSLKLHPSNAYAYKNRALIYLALEDGEKACEDLYLARGYGFRQIYGDEVKELLEKNCIK